MIESRAHPRVCGENEFPQDAVGLFPGSSPRMRGKQEFESLKSLASGLIPAYAGKTNQNDTVSVYAWAHPRVCGENRRAKCESIILMGSSPRMRGKQRRGSLQALRVGLIPAYAGKTGRSISAWLNKWAHPRVCGENLYFLRLAEPTNGSSPRMRGKLLWWSTGFRVHGLIPAYAGKTTAPTNRGFPQGAHPRVCGENRL